MKGERKTPTRMLTPRLNQLELTFLMISLLRIVLGSEAEAVFLPRTVESVLGDELVPHFGHQLTPSRFDLPDAGLGHRSLPAPGLGNTDKRNVLAPILGCDPLILFQLFQFPHSISGA